ncbi:MAG: SCP2 sterol-binding domain-containing protein [bacterium]
MDKITIPRPEDGISPQEFFERWLPETLGEMDEVIQKNAGELEFVLCVRVEGEGGGDWSVLVEDGEVEVRPGLPDNGDLTLVLSRRDFEDAVTGRLDDLLPGMSWLQRGSEGADPARIAEDLRSGSALLQKLKGSLRFCADDKERPFRVLLKFGPEAGDEPDTVVTIDQEVLRQTARGETNLVQAFMSGKVKVEGAMDLIMQMAPLFS